MKTTTLNKIRNYNPCKDGWEKLLKFLGKTEADDEPLLMSTILRSNGLSDALWCLRAFRVDHRQSVIDFACDCAERVLATWEEWAEKYAPEYKDTPRKAIKAARSGDRNAVVYAARAADAAYVACDAADARAAYAAAAARAADVTYAAAAAASAAAARAADVAAAARAADAARVADAVAAAAAAAPTEAYVDERKEQEKLLIKYFG